MELSSFDYIDTMVDNYNKDYSVLCELYDSLKNTPDHLTTMLYSNHGGYLKHDFKNVDVELKALHWREVYNRSNISDIISSARKDEITNHFYNKSELPDFNYENIKSTLTIWFSDLNKMFCEKVDTCFKKLSGTHVTNQPQGFTKKIIYKNMVDYTWFTTVFNTYTFKTSAIDIIHDLRTAIQTLYKLPISDRYNTELILKSINERNEYTSFDNGAFKIKVFKNGNAHIELHPHVAIMLNCELAKLYPNAIPPVHRTECKEIKTYEFNYTKLSNNEISNLRDLILRSTHSIDNGRHVYKIKSYYIPQVEDILHFLGVTIDDKTTFSADYDIVEAIRHIITNGIVDYKSNQFYPTPDIIVDFIYDSIPTVKGKTILEPSAGMGNIARKFKDGVIQCMEKEPLNCIILNLKGLNVEYGDFLLHNKKYDIIVMNPPYNNKQWKTHTNHAVSLLNDGGAVYAALPVNKKHEFECNVEVLATFDNEFDNTQISISVYKLTKG